MKNGVLLRGMCFKRSELIVTCHTESAVERIENDLRVNKICTWSLSHYRMINRWLKMASH